MSGMTTANIFSKAAFLLSEHPTIVNFRWSHTQSWGSTWTFLFSAIILYIAISIFLRFLARPMAIPLGPVPALHSLALALISATIFAGTLLSAAAEIRDTRWLWTLRGGARLTPAQWLLCFPLGTRPSGRVFFWSYLFYLSRFLHMSRAVVAVALRRRLSLFRLVNHSILAVASFLWLEFSQSLQVPAILTATLAHAAVHGYRFWTAVGLPGACFPFVVACRVALLACHVACHVAALALHVVKGRGCNGVGGAWLLNSLLNAVILFLFLNFYAKDFKRSTKNNKVM